MATTLDNLLDQSLDIAGTCEQRDDLDVTEESLQLGQEVSGQLGSTASISGIVPNIVISGLTGMVENSEGRFLTIEGASDPGNNGTFLITQYISPSTVVVENVFGFGPDANNGSVIWTERQPWVAQDDHNYHRSDRANIKGVAFDGSVPTYFRVDNKIVPVPANLANIAGKTTDAKALVDNLKFQTLSVSPGDTFITLTSVGDLKHADAVDTTGVPIWDGYDAGNIGGTFVAILDDDGYATELTVAQDQLGGAMQGWRIIGRTRAGASTSPNSVEVEFRAVELGAELSTSVPYTWESSQPSEIDSIIGYRTGIDDLDENALRKLLLFGVVYGGQSTGGGSGPSVNLPLPTEYGQFFFSQDGVEFIPAVPVVNDEGLIMVDENGKVVVVGV